MAFQKYMDFQKLIFPQNQWHRFPDFCGMAFVQCTVCHRGHSHFGGRLGGVIDISEIKSLAFQKDEYARLFESYDYDTRFRGFIVGAETIIYTT
jgi:hypothetical protein